MDGEVPGVLVCRAAGVRRPMQTNMQPDYEICCFFQPDNSQDFPAPFRAGKAKFSALDVASIAMCRARAKPCRASAG
jgi:hypothetical protein